MNKQEFNAIYSDWKTERIEEALSVDRKDFRAEVIQFLEAELQRRGTRLPVRCPHCPAFNPISAHQCFSCGFRFSKEPEITALPLPPEEVEPALALHRSPFEDLSRAYRGQTFGGVESLPVRCPACTLMNPDSAPSCSSCGYVFLPPLEGKINKVFYSPEKSSAVPESIAREIDTLSKQAFRAGLMAVLGFAVIFGIIMVPSAIWQGSEALRKIRAFPEYANAARAKDKALTGLILGWLALFLYVALLAGLIIARFYGSDEFTD